MANLLIGLAMAILLAHSVIAQISPAGLLITVGNYEIYKCNKGKGMKEDQVKTVLQAVLSDMPTILVEANIGENSDYGFKSLFTSNAAIKTVTDNFGKISDEDGVLVGGQPTKVRFVCLEPDDPETSPVLAEILASQPRAGAYSRFNTQFIFLTPFFFYLQPFPQPYRCPEFWENIITRNPSDILGTTQYGIIIHELLDKYMHFSGSGGHREVYNLRNCIALSPERQLLNAENYQMFASALKAGCDKFPK